MSTTPITIAGNVFIIPNLARSLSSCVVPEHWDEQVEKFIKGFATLGISENSLSSSPKEERWIQVWYYTPKEVGGGSENWTDHGHPAFASADEDGYATEWIPGFLPASLLKEKKEGDKLVIEGEKYTFELTCQQDGHRYRNFGNFEDVVTKINRDYVPS